MLNLFISLLLLNHLMAQSLPARVRARGCSRCRSSAPKHLTGGSQRVPCIRSRLHPWHSCLITLSRLNLCKPFLCLPSGPFPGFLLPSFPHEVASQGFSHEPCKLSSRPRYSPVPLGSDIPKRSKGAKRGLESEAWVESLLLPRRGAGSWLPVQPQELLQAPASSQARCWAQGRALPGAAGASALRLRALQEATRSAEAAAGPGEGGSLPQTPAGRSADRLQPARSPGAQLLPTWGFFFFSPCSWSGLSGVLEAFSFLLGA